MVLLQHVAAGRVLADDQAAARVVAVHCDADLGAGGPHDLREGREEEHATRAMAIVRLHIAKSVVFSPELRHLTSGINNGCLCNNTVCSEKRPKISRFALKPHRRRVKRLFFKKRTERVRWCGPTAADRASWVPLQSVRTRAPAAVSTSRRPA